MATKESQRLSNIRYQAKKKGLAPPETDDLDTMEVWWKQNKQPRRSAGPKAARAGREQAPAKRSGKARRGGYKKHATAPPAEPYAQAARPAPAPVSGNGHVLTARAIALEELDKMIASLTSTRAIMASLPAEG